MYKYSSTKTPAMPKSGSEKTDFIEQAKAARQQRAMQQTHDTAAVTIQACVRRFLARCQFEAHILDEFDSVFSFNDSESAIVLKPASSVYPAARLFVTFCCRGKLSKRMEFLCKYILQSLTSESMQLNYLSLLLKKELSSQWIEHLKRILKHCLHSLRSLKPENAAHLRCINTILTMLVSFTSAVNWKILSGKSGDVLRPAMTQVCSNIMQHLRDQNFLPTIEILLSNGLVKTKPCFKVATFTAICSLLLRCFATTTEGDEMLRQVLLHIFSVPALLYHMEAMCSDVYNRLVASRIFTRCLEFLSSDEQLQAVAVTLEGNHTLCLVANLIQIGMTEKEGIVQNSTKFTLVLIKLLEVCGQFMMGKKSSKSHWHPILGWASHPFNYNEAVPYMMKQLQLLWQQKTINLLFHELMDFSRLCASASQAAEEKKSGLLKKKSDRKQPIKVSSAEVANVCISCQLYQTAKRVLVQIHTEILTGLAFHPSLLQDLWTLMKNLSGGGTCLKPFLDSFSGSLSSPYEPPITTLLMLFCDAGVMLFMILDDMEMYDSQKPFSLEDLVLVSDMLNQFVFRIIWQDVIDWRQADAEPAFNSAHSLLQLLHERDSRRSYTPPNHWLIRDIRPSQFISSIDKGNKTAQFLLQKMPHIVTHKDRVVLFHKLVINEKEALGITESSHSTPSITFITVHRQRLLEDGYRQLAGLPALALKGIIRVKFINEQGLDEAGIDQDGVFKEFLEETIKRVFDPSLNLFKVTDEQKLYPSPISSLQDNHLSLFEFVGRMIGKAVYESIVVDVPFAPFFLTQVLDNMKNSMYSYLDELPSLDPELYRNLTYVKHYDGDISDLDLNFSYDEDFMGSVRNFELRPGGSAIAVSNENKISYVHNMARFKMHTQIKEQTVAFIRGFKSIINYDWLSMFSTPEVQKLISGDTVDIDLADLRKHTQYYGGFHNNHRVINWLWEILHKDFDEAERKQFLKFVTSCSKPPLLGFSQLEPPFSIRCVEVSDDQDTGDTIGSVLKGFFSIRKNEPAGRLPTASTCFNLLKLPNYGKKRTLREKLRYSITCNTGFELS